MTELEENKIIHWLKKQKRLIIGLITIILIVLMIFIVDFPSLLSKLSRIGIWGIIILITIYTSAFLIRAYKLKLIFKGFSKNIKFTNSFLSIGVSFFVNDLTPGQLGDIAKILIIKDREKLLLSESFAGVAVERVIDLIFLFSISCFALIFLYISNFGEIENIKILGQDLQLYIIIGAILIITILILFIILFYKQNIILNITNKFSKKITNYLERFLTNFKGGLKKFKDHKEKLLLIILLNFPIYIFDALIVSLFFYLIIPYNYNILVLVLATLVLFFSKVIPLTPGGWVISENIGALFVSIFYPTLAYSQILSVFIIDHLIRSAYIFFFGGYAILHFNFKLKETKKIIE